MSASFGGLSVAVITPFKPDFSVDYAAWQHHIRFMVHSAVDSVVVCGTTGESATVNDEEFIRLIEAAAEAAKGSKTMVIAGSGSNNTQASIQKSRAAIKAGANALLLVGPYYNKPPQRGLIAHFNAIADAAEVPCILYNVPGRTASNLLPETVATLAEHPHIVAIKEASGDLAQIKEVIKRVPDDFTVMSGDDLMALPAILNGAKGVTSVAANVAPVMMKSFVDACLLNDAALAGKWHEKLTRLFQFLFVESNPIPIKAALAHAGHIHNVLRLPLVPMSDEHLPAMKQALSDLDLIG